MKIETWLIFCSNSLNDEMNDETRERLDWREMSCRIGDPRMSSG